MADETNENDLITLVDEDGQEHQFSLVDLIELDERRYALMIPADDQATAEEEEEAYVFRLETDDKGEDILVDIEDEDEFERVCAAFDEMDEAVEDDDEEE